MKYCFSFFLFLHFLSFAFAQSPSEEIHFAQYLINNKQFHDAIYILKKEINNKTEATTSDSINYYIGWSYFNLKVLDSSFIYFSKVLSGPFYHQASFYAVFNKAFLKKTSDAKAKLDSIHLDNDSSLTKLRNFEFAGIALLERDYEEYEKHSKNFSYNYFPLADEEKKTTDYYSQLKRVKRKSPFLAGAMSAVLPGSGKFYAGYKGQGIAALMTVGVLGISAAECYYRLGYKSPQFITFGSLFAIFYVGNIWGSTLSVKLAREHKYHEIDDEILFNMHIPLRRIFN